MNACIHVPIIVCLYVYTYVCTYVCTYVYIDMCVYIDEQVFTFSVSACVCVCVCDEPVFTLSADRTTHVVLLQHMFTTCHAVFTFSAHRTPT